MQISHDYVSDMLTRVEAETLSNQSKQDQPARPTKGQIKSQKKK